MNREERFMTSMKLWGSLVGRMEPVEAQVYVEMCERVWAGREQLRQVRK